MKLYKFSRKISRNVIAIFQIFESFLDNNISLLNVKSRQESFEERIDDSINLYLVEKDDASVSSKSSKGSSLHTMGPLMEDFLFLEKIAFSPNLLKDMLGKYLYI